jgi:hypothetical protein
MLPAHHLSPRKRRGAVSATGIEVHLFNGLCHGAASRCAQVMRR